MKVQWTCPHCSHKNKWRWPEFFASDTGPITMECEKCEKGTQCRGDGLGNFWPMLPVDSQQLTKDG